MNITNIDHFITCPTDVNMYIMHLVREEGRRRMAVTCKRFAALKNAFTHVLRFDSSPPSLSMMSSVAKGVSELVKAPTSLNFFTFRSDLYVPPLREIIATNLSCPQVDQILQHALRLKLTSIRRITLRQLYGSESEELALASTLGQISSLEVLTIDRSKISGKCIPLSLRTLKSLIVTCCNEITTLSLPEGVEHLDVSHSVFIQRINSLANVKLLRNMGGFKHSEIFATFMGNKYSGFDLSAKDFNIEEMRQLLLQGANPNAGIPLGAAIEKRNFKAQRLLMDFGADPKLLLSVRNFEKYWSVRLKEGLFWMGKTVSFSEEETRYGFNFAIPYNLCYLARILIEHGILPKENELKDILEKNGEYGHITCAKLKDPRFECLAVAKMLANDARLRERVKVDAEFLNGLLERYKSPPKVPS